jgi:hypothetical protein
MLATAYMYAPESHGSAMSCVGGAKEEVREATERRVEAHRQTRRSAADRGRHRIAGAGDRAASEAIECMRKDEIWWMVVRGSWEGDTKMSGGK